MLRTLAYYAARRTVVEQLRRQGYKLTSTTAAEITAATKAYYTEHSDECISRAATVIASSAVLQRMIERQHARRAKLNTGAQNAKARETGLSAVHHSCSKGGNE
jgi:hypothetical protein